MLMSETMSSNYGADFSFAISILLARNYEKLWHPKVISKTMNRPVLKPRICGGNVINSKHE